MSRTYDRDMSVRGFFKALFSRQTGGTSRNTDDLSRKVRDAMGPQAGGARGGRMTGNAVYRLFENKSDKK